MPCGRASESTRAFSDTASEIAAAECAGGGGRAGPPPPVRGMRGADTRLAQHRAELARVLVDLRAPTDGQRFQHVCNNTR
jgi:hypothetical protein